METKESPCFAQSSSGCSLSDQNPMFPTISTASSPSPCRGFPVPSCKKQQVTAKFNIHSSPGSAKHLLKLPSPRCLLKSSRKQFDSCVNNVSLHSCHTYYSRFSSHFTDLNEFLQCSCKRDERNILFMWRSGAILMRILITSPTIRPCVRVLLGWAVTLCTHTPKCAIHPNHGGLSFLRSYLIFAV